MMFRFNSFSSLSWLFILSLFAACDGNKDQTLTLGTSLTVEVDGLRSLIDRMVALGDSRVLAIGTSGRNLEGHLIWADLDGNVIEDLSLEHIRQPQQMAACVRGTNGVALFVTPDEGASRVHQVVLEQDRFQPQGSDVSWAGPDSGPVQIRSIEGPGHGCGMCIHRPLTGELRCHLDPGDAEAHSATVGFLGHWSVQWVGERFVLADWSADDEGWIAVRVGLVDLGTAGGAFTWQHSYRIGGLPDLARPDADREIQPRIVATSDGLDVVFVDGTEWFTRIFLQRFPLDAGTPPEAIQVKSCRGSCSVSWAGHLDGATWIWYRDAAGTFAERFTADGRRTSTQFNPPADVMPAGDGIFKMGLGNTLGNWWAILSHR